MKRDMEHYETFPVIRTYQRSLFRASGKMDNRLNESYEQGARHMLCDIINYLESTEQPEEHLDFFREQLKELKKTEVKK
jgi:hypothetical protein